MFIIEFSQPGRGNAKFVGPFGSEMAAHVWVEENDRHGEIPVVYPLTDPASEMFRSLLAI